MTAGSRQRCPCPAGLLARRQAGCSSLTVPLPLGRGCCEGSALLRRAAAAPAFPNMCALKGKRLLPACLTPSSWQHPTIHVIRPYWDLSRDIVKQAHVYLREAVLIAQWDKELAGTRQISRWHGKGTAGLRLTMGCSERTSLTAGGFFSLQTSVFFF